MSFANPAVTIARSLSDTFAGIAPAGVAAFIAAQITGGLAGLCVAEMLFRVPAADQGTAPGTEWNRNQGSSKRLLVRPSCAILLSSTRHFLCDRFPRLEGGPDWRSKPSMFPTGKF
jgi:glycerol uptake facilitator-like aquaporin